MFRDASLIESPWGALVFGTNAPFFDRPISVDSMFAGGEVEGAVVAPPPGRFTFTAPLAFYAEGSLQLVWIEPDPVPTQFARYEWATTQFEEVWTASSRELGVWSTPSRAYSGDFRWHAAGLDQARDASRDGRIVFTSGAEFIVLSFAKPVVGVQRVPVPLYFPAYASLVARGADIVITFVAADPSIAHDNNSVFALTSADSGKRWRSPVLVHRSGDARAFEAKVLRASNGQLHVIWRAESNDGTTLHHASSSDMGRSWSESEHIQVPAHSANLRVTMDRADRIHAVYEDWQGGGASGHVDHIVWDGAWQPPTHLFLQLRPMNPSLLAQEDGDVVIAFLSPGIGVPIAQSTLTSLYTRWHCSATP